MLRRSSRVSFPITSAVSRNRSNSQSSLSSVSIGGEESDCKRTKRRKLNGQKARKPKKEHNTNNNGGLSGDIEELAPSPPPNWQLQFEALREFRRTGRPAAVDTMGCDIHEHIDPKTKRLHCLISLMLSAQCKDEYNALVMTMLKQTLPRGLTLDDLLEIDQDELAILIRPCGLHNNKAKYIKRTAIILRDEFGGDIPDTADAMIRSLPGVGAKMAYLCMGSAWNTISGIGVDTHVHRICNLLGWVKTNTPEKTRVALESWLPREYWREINHMLVGHGQLTCRPIGRRCEECPLSQEGELQCPSVVVNKSPRKKIVKYESGIKVEESSLVGLSPTKQSYDARFPDIKIAERHIKTEEDAPFSNGESHIPASVACNAETGTDLDGVKEESIESLAVEQSPYFRKAVERNNLHV